MNKDIIKSIISSNYKFIYVIDILSDSVIKYIYRNNDFIEEEKFSFTDYINKCRDSIKEENIDKYINSMNIQYLENSKSNGQDYISLEYFKKNNNGEYKKYCDIVKLYDYAGKKYILDFSNEMTDNIETKDVVENNLEVNLNKIIDDVSLSIFKIYNIVNGEGDLNTKKDYLNTIIGNLTSSYPKLNKSLVDNSVYIEGGKRTILIVDDDKMTCSILRKIFSIDYEVITCNDGKSAIDILSSKQHNINCIFLDLLMPILDGFGVLEYLDNNNYLKKIPVIIISGNYDKETRNRAYSYEIADMLEKPFNVQVIKHRIDNLISLYKTSNLVNQMLVEQHKELKNIAEDLVKSYLYDYSSDIPVIKQLVSIFTETLAKDYPEYNLNQNVLEKIVDSSIYYDIHKYVLPKSFLNKNVYNSFELDIMKEVCTNIANIGKYIKLEDKADIKYVTDIIKYRNERFDGKGFPDMASGNAIPLISSIVNICAEYLNLYRMGKSNDEVYTIITHEANSKYDPKIIGVFQKNKDRFNQVIK